ncbi:hypothetical protein ACOMHN_042370 [Nucella lapillus]
MDQDRPSRHTTHRQQQHRPSRHTTHRQQQRNGPGQTLPTHKTPTTTTEKWTRTDPPDTQHTNNNREMDQDRPSRHTTHRQQQRNGPGQTSPIHNTPTTTTEKWTRTDPPDTQHTDNNREIDQDKPSRHTDNNNREMDQDRPSRHTTHRQQQRNGPGQTPPPPDTQHTDNNNREMDQDRPSRHTTHRQQQQRNGPGQTFPTHNTPTTTEKWTRTDPPDTQHTDNNREMDQDRPSRHTKHQQQQRNGPGQTPPTHNTDNNREMDQDRPPPDTQHTNNNREMDQDRPPPTHNTPTTTEKWTRTDRPRHTTHQQQRNGPGQTAPDTQHTNNNNREMDQDRPPPTHNTLTTTEKWTRTDLPRHTTHRQQQQRNGKHCHVCAAPLS